MKLDVSLKARNGFAAKAEFVFFLRSKKRNENIDPVSSKITDFIVEPVTTARSWDDGESCRRV